MPQNGQTLVSDHFGTLCITGLKLYNKSNKLKVRTLFVIMKLLFRVLNLTVSCKKNLSFDFGKKVYNLLRKIFGSSSCSGVHLH